jgi:transcriptional regulator with XRE-family HTH domain
MLCSMSFGTRLRALREQKGLTQDGLGKGLGTAGADAGKAVVYGWEKDQHHPRVDQLMLICKRLGCSADYLLFGTESNLTSEALSVAKWFDRLTDPRDRAVAETGAMGVILRVLQQHDLPPTDSPDSDFGSGTPRGPAKTPAPPDPPTPAKKQTRQAERLGRKR